MELIQNTLKTSLEIINTDRVSFNFTCLLHTYFKCKVDDIKIYGLQNSDFIDKLTNKCGVEANNAVRVDQHVDKIYKNVFCDFLTFGIFLND